MSMTGHPDIVAQRLRGLGLRGSTSTTPREVVRRLLVMQAQEHPHARWSVAQRMARPTTAAEIDAAFDDGELLRTHVLRPTWHYVAPDDLRWLLTLSGPRVEAWNARRLDELELDIARLDRSLTEIHEALGGGPLTRPELGAVLGAEGQQLAYLTMHAELQMVICSGPMRGKRHTYVRFDDRVPPSPAISEDEALVRLASRYLETRSPATVKDFAWWSGLKMADARRAIAGVEAERIEIDGRTYFSTSTSMSAPVEPGVPGPIVVDLVQCYDELIISYTESRDVLRTDRAGFAVPGRPDGGFMHVVLVDGRLLGQWRVVKGAVEVRLAHDVDRTTRDALGEAVAAYERWAR
jgi:hypothetical protein